MIPLSSNPQENADRQNDEGRGNPLTRDSLMESLMNQRRMAFEVWVKKYPVAGTPGKQRFMDRAEQWISDLPEKTLDGIIEVSQTPPRVVVIPKANVKTLIELIDANKVFDGQQNTSVQHPLLWNVTASSWKLAITDGRLVIPFDHTICYQNPTASETARIKRSNPAMLDEYSRQYQAEGLGGIMPMYGYLPTTATFLADPVALTSLTQGQGIDYQNFSAFAVPDADDVIATAHWITPNQTKPLSSSDFVEERSLLSTQYGNRVALGIMPKTNDTTKRLRARYWLETDI